MFLYVDVNRVFCNEGPQANLTTEPFQISLSPLYPSFSTEKTFSDNRDRIWGTNDDMQP